MTAALNTIAMRQHYEKVIQDLFEKEIRVKKHKESCEVVGCLECQYCEMECLSIEGAISMLRYYQP
jgi:hypothetical protein